VSDVLNNHSICFQNRSLKDERFFLPKKKAKYELVNAANFGKSREVARRVVSQLLSPVRSLHCNVNIFS
jgi:hypothetical protein